MSFFKGEEIKTDEYYLQQAEITWNLLNEATALASQMLLQGQPFSMTGYSVRKNGEYATHIITANSDEEMFSKAKAAVRLAPTARFALIGEGKIGKTAEDAAPAFIAYYQDPTVPVPICVYRHYRKVSEEKIEQDQGWTIVRQLPESWL